jgi:hypothetical protein
MSMIKLSYRDREKVPGALTAVIEARHGQIAIGPIAAKMFAEQYQTS